MQRKEKDAERQGVRRTDVVEEALGGPKKVAGKVFQRRYGELRGDLPEYVKVTVLTPLGERTDAGIALWDTGADSVTLGKHFADRLGIEPMPPMDGDGNPTTTANMRFLGTATARLQIGDIVFPFKRVNVTDFDPDGAQRAAGIELPDLLIGMNIIGLGRLTVDSTSGETVVTFEME